jgi:predicted GNAT family acetyltransferase
MKDPNSDLWVLEFQGVVISFSHYLRFFPGYVWFEGLRTDPEFQGRGAGRALTLHMVQTAKKEGASRIGLSLYSGNVASLRLAESLGFKKKASFVYLEGSPGDLPSKQKKFKIVPICPFEVGDFLGSSNFLFISNGYLPLGWRFVPLSLGKEFALSQIKVALGIMEGGEISSLLLSSEFSQPYEGFSLDFLDGEREEMLGILSSLREVIGDRKSVEAFIPKCGKKEAPALSLFRNLSFKTWDDFQEDVFVLELELS